MTREERTTIRMAINAAKRAWLHSEGGYTAVERDARAMDQRIVRGGRGDKGRQERARQLRQEGWSFVRIGAELGVHHSTVWGWLNPGRTVRLVEQQRRRRAA